MIMKNLLFSMVCFLVMLTATGQEREFNTISYGFQLVKFHNEFGFGVQLLTPEFNNLRITVKANINWLSHINNDNINVWTNFYSNQAGINYYTAISSRIGLYSEGGIVLLYPNKAFSDEKVNIGGYGLFGFEFFFTENIARNPSYFIELGGIGSSAAANKLPEKTIYANGFLISAGFRF